MVKLNQEKKSTSTDSNKKTKEEELRRRLQKLFKNKPPPEAPMASKELNNKKQFNNKKEQRKSEEIKANVVKQAAKDFPKKKKLEESKQTQNVHKNGGSAQQLKKQKQNKHKKQSQTNGYATPIENGGVKESKLLKKEKKKSKANIIAGSAKEEISKDKASKPQLPKQKKKKTRKRKAAAEMKTSPTKKQMAKQKVELPPEVLHIDSSEFSFSDFSDEQEAAADEERAGLYSTDDNSNDLEYSFSDFQDEIAAPSNGYVPGGDFDNNYEDNYYNNQNDSHLHSDDDHDYSQDDDYSEDDDYSQDDDDYSWAHNDGNYDDDDDDDTYSDIDESDYDDEDGSSLDYASDMDNDDFQASGSDDEDYKLPEHVPEDLIIHRGTADKRELFESDEVVFSEDCDGAQIVELRHQISIKSITQPEGYHRTALEELSEKEINASPQLIAQQKQTEQAQESDSDCPKLVPIVDEDGFQMYSEELHDAQSCDSFNSSDYEELSDEDGSIISIDVNSKYLQESEEQDSSTNDDDEDKVAIKKRKEGKMSAEVIEAINTEGVEGMVTHEFHGELNSENSTNEMDVPPSKKFKGEKKAKGTVITTKVNVVKRKLREQPKEASAKIKGKTTLCMQHEVTSTLKTTHNEDVVKADVLDSSAVESTVSAVDSNISAVKPTIAAVESTLPTMGSTNFAMDSTISAMDSTTSAMDSSISAMESTTPIKVKTKMSSTPSERSERSTVSKVSSLSIKSIFCNAIDSNDVLVLLRESLSIYGTLKLTPIAGSIEIYGYTPKYGEELEIFSTRGLSTVQIVPKSSSQQSSQKTQNLNKDLQQLQEHFSKADIQKIRDKFNPLEDALILLKRNESRKKLVATFKKYMNENVFPNMNSIQADRPFYASECRLRCVINATEEYDRPLRWNPQWEQLKVQENSRILLIGGKSVGKSTLLRILVNRNLVQYPRMLVLDLDIGQAELFVPQTISAAIVERPLLGPGFFLNQQPVHSFAIGHSNIVLCPHRYMRAVKELINYCQSQPELTQLPWLINSMGYNKGFGAELIATICDYLQPTDVVQLQSNKDINNYDYFMEPQLVATLPRNIYSGEEYHQVERTAESLNFRLHVFNSAITQESRYQRDWEMSSKDLRYANMLSRLSGILVGHADWFSDCKPLCASLDSLKFLNLLSTGYTREQILKSIEANLVYLCRQEDNETTVRCFGIGVVRAIDYHINQIYLLPALPQHRMTEVNCLAIGEMPLPTSMLTNQGPKVSNTAPFLYNTIAANASKSIKQIFYRPPQFLGGKRKSIN